MFNSIDKAQRLLASLLLRVGTARRRCTVFLRNLSRLKGFTEYVMDQCKLEEIESPNSM